MSWRNILPSTLGLSKIEVGSQDTPASVQASFRVFNMYVVDTVSKLFGKGCRIEELRSKMAWIKVNAKARTVTDGIERLACCHKIVGNFSRMYLQTIPHAFPLKYIDNGIPATGKI